MPETPEASITLYHAPRTRSFTALWLLEELEVPYKLEGFTLSSGRHKQPDFLALNPMGKVPVVVDAGTPVSELGAIAIYMSDRHRKVALSPGPDDPARPAFLRWAFFSSAVMEPALAERFSKWEARPGQHAWGSFDQMLGVLSEAVRERPYLLGQSFSAADVLVGATARFGMLFGAFPNEGPIPEYINRLTAREAFARASAIEQRQGALFPPRKS